MHMQGTCLARLVFQRQDDERTIAMKLDTNGCFNNPNARLRNARADEKKTKTYSKNDAAGEVTHRSHPKVTIAIRTLSEYLTL